MYQPGYVAARAGSLAPVLRVWSDECHRWWAIRGGNRLLAFCGRWGGDRAGAALSAELRGQSSGIADHAGQTAHAPKGNSGHRPRIIR